MPISGKRRLGGLEASAAGGGNLQGSIARGEMMHRSVESERAPSPAPAGVAPRRR
jgi:hypothetical protein